MINISIFVYQRASGLIDANALVRAYNLKPYYYPQIPTNLDLNTNKIRAKFPKDVSRGLFSSSTRTIAFPNWLGICLIHFAIVLQVFY